MPLLSPPKGLRAHGIEATVIHPECGGVAQAQAGKYGSARTREARARVPRRARVASAGTVALRRAQEAAIPTLGEEDAKRSSRERAEESR